MPISINALERLHSRPVVYTLAHGMFPYTSAQVSISYVHESNLITAPILDATNSKEIFDFGGTSKEIMVFSFSRMNKPPDVPALLTAFTGINKRTLVRHEITMQAPQVDPQTGSTTYHCNGSAVYMMSLSSPEAVQTRTFYYPKSPIDGSNVYATTSTANGSSVDNWTSIFYEWLGGLEAPVIKDDFYQDITSTGTVDSTGPDSGDLTGNTNV